MWGGPGALQDGKKCVNKTVQKKGRLGGERWGCTGGAVGVHWGCTGGAVGVHWGCSGGAVGVPCASAGSRGYPGKLTLNSVFIVPDLLLYTCQVPEGPAGYIYGAYRGA